MNDLLEKASNYADEYGWVQEQFLLACVSEGNEAEIKKMLLDKQFIERTKKLFETDMSFALTSYMFVWPQISRIAASSGVDEDIASEIYLKYTIMAKYAKTLSEIMEINVKIFIDYAQAVSNIKEDMKYSMLVRNCRSYIRKNIYGILTLGSIAKALHFSKSYLSHAYKKETGETVYQRVQIEKIAKAKLFLKNPALSFSEIQNKLGFCSQSHFAQFFKSGTGLTLSEFRARFCAHVQSSTQYFEDAL